MKEPFVAFMEREIDPCSVLIACGLPASYKTETTEVIAALKGHRVLRTDMLRLEVLRDEDIFDEKVAANMNKRALVYDEMFSLAHELAARGQGVILDATFITQKLRRRAAEVAARHALPLIIQETRCPREVSLKRISRRTKENYQSNALTEQAYTNNLKRFEPVDLEDLKRSFPSLSLVHLVVDTTSDAAADWRVVGKTALEPSSRATT